ncbi:MAG: selenide, water dikinase SelD [Bacteroidales bacterium]|nr:selenide, water dikinase SelD [Bacteroidales bacterium]
MKPIYLDYNATTPVDRAVVEAMRPYLEEHFGNPSSLHQYGTEAKKAIMKARSQLASLLNCMPEEIIFTSGGSESNNMAIMGVMMKPGAEGRHMITSEIEHPAVIEVCRHLEKKGIRVTYLPVDRYGWVDPQDVRHAVRPDTILISIMHANNEVGTIQPIPEISHIARAHGILFHTDAAQSTGKIPVDVKELGVDMLSIAGHKFYAPKGVGALYIRAGIPLEKMIHGADHERNMRAGTENVPEIAGLGMAAELALSRMREDQDRIIRLRDLFFSSLAEQLGDIHLNGHPEKRLPNTVNISFPGTEANLILAEASDVAASAGAACHADRVDKSHVLEAMGVPDEWAMGAVRFSLGRNTTVDDIRSAAEIVGGVVRKLRGRIEGVVPGQQHRSFHLTRYTQGLGCGCKIRPQKLEQILADLPLPDDPSVLVGAGTSDDAAVFTIPAGKAVVQTVDFITPVVDDPYHFGAVAAANAISDIYAMGADPLYALNIVSFPDSRLPIEVLKEILKGAHDKAREAGIWILGGHSVDDPEPKFGMVVTGVADPGRILTNSGALKGDVLVLTKPLGAGILTTAMKRELLDGETSSKCIRIMSDLNREAAQIMKDLEVHACTDISGFGLMGHLMEMVRASNVTAEVRSGSIPIIDRALDLATEGVVPGGTYRNMEFVEHTVEWHPEVTGSLRIVLCDAQTSGGLLISLPMNDSRYLLEQLTKMGKEARIIGSIMETGPGKILCLP